MFTGSVSLQLVLRSLREAGSTNAPINDMYPQTVQPLTRHHTCELAKNLLRQTGAAPPQIPRLASAIADYVGGFPFHVHHTIDKLNEISARPNLEDVSTAVGHLLHDPRDPADLRYFRDRLSSYYPDDQQKLALLVLDTLAHQPSGTPVPDLLNLCRLRRPSLARERFLGTLTILLEDNYIERVTSTTGLAYDFRWSLLKRWWQETRP